MGDAGRAFGGRGIRAIENRRWSALWFLGVVLAEYRRAVAAAKRYEDWQRAGAPALARHGILPTDIPRRIFDEFYASTTEPRCGPGQDRELMGMLDQPHLQNHGRTRISGGPVARSCAVRALPGRGSCRATR